jgi:hypothetical protein
VERELASLAPWAWDPLVGKHAPGDAMMRDFAEVAADKVVTTNTDTYDSYRFAAPEEAFETNADERERGATSEDKPRRVRDRRASSLVVAAVARGDPPKQTKKPAKSAAGRSPLSNAPIARSTPGAPAPSTAQKATPKSAIAKKRLSPPLAEATPLSDEAGAPNARSAQPGTLKKSEGETRLPAVGAEANASTTPSRGKKKTKPRSALSKAPRFKSGGKNLGDALERAVEDEAVARMVVPPAGKGPGKENAPPTSGGANGGEGPSNGIGDPSATRAPKRKARAAISAPPLADLGEARRHREAALLAVAAAEADAEAAASGPAMTPSQQLLQAYYDLTGSRTLPAAARRRDPRPAEAERAGASLADTTRDRTSSDSSRDPSREYYAPAFDAAPRPVCVTVGPFPGTFPDDAMANAEGRSARGFGFSSFDAYERLPRRVVPLTACVARACDYLGKRDAEEARRELP